MTATVMIVSLNAGCLVSWVSWWVRRRREERWLHAWALDRRAGGCALCKGDETARGRICDWHFRPVPEAHKPGGPVGLGRTS